MSNSIPTRLSIFGELQRVEELTKALYGFDVVSQNLSLLNLSFTVPLPDYEVDRKWYDINWGTKFIDFPDNASWMKVENGKFIDFYSDSIPPIAWLKSTAQKYDDLRFEMHYADSGNATYGFFTSQNNVFEDHDVSLLFLKNLINKFEGIDLENRSLVYQTFMSFDKNLIPIVDLTLSEYEFQRDFNEPVNDMYGELVGLIQIAGHDYESIYSLYNS